MWCCAGLDSPVPAAGPGGRGGAGQERDRRCSVIRLQMRASIVKIRGKLFLFVKQVSQEPSQ